jgi:hypothetical protein
MGAIGINHLIATGRKIRRSSEVVVAIKLFSSKSNQDHRNSRSNITVLRLTAFAMAGGS